MAKIYKGALGLIGNTPLVEISNIEKELSLQKEYGPCIKKFYCLLMSLKWI